MSKRKAGVNDIIYELDNEDIEISSDDEAKEAKIHRINDNEADNTPTITLICEKSSAEVINVDCSQELNTDTTSQNGGKTLPSSPDVKLVEEKPTIINISQSSDSPETKIENTDEEPTESSEVVLNEDIEVDSPESDSDLGVVGCENRTPLVTVKFRDKKFAKNYKDKIKAFMLTLIKLHDEESLTGSETETDLELDVWPEDLIEHDVVVAVDVVEEKKEEDNLFFVDTDPCDLPQDIPSYRQNSMLISNVPEEPSPPPTARRGPTCFNCDGAHSLRDCTLPRNNMKIAENRKNMTTRVGRYHVEDDQKFGHFVAGRISGNLRHALGLKRHELPIYIYRMRQLGYPPGWLEEARISHSGITMFDSCGTAIQDPEEEDGEVCEPGSKDKFDIKKILDFPGFNVPASSRYKEEAHLLGLPPISEQDSKMAMLQKLAPNAMKAYKRKKLTFFPSASNNSLQQEQAEMDLDSGDESADFPSQPPLPDDAPPPPPPPPPPLPETPPLPDAPPPAEPESAEVPLEPQEVETEKEGLDDSFVTIDEDRTSQESSGRNSPSLDDLEEKKRRLLDALDNGSVISEMDTDKAVVNTEENTKNESEVCTDSAVSQDGTESSQDKAETKLPSDSDSELTKTPDSKAGNVKTTLYGTPVMNIASSYTKLPTDSMFAKDICDIINFENLPNSTGKYKKICSMLKKVKDEVDRIQDS